jgi:hypothetical protein
MMAARYPDKGPTCSLASRYRLEPPGSLAAGRWPLAAGRWLAGRWLAGRWPLAAGRWLAIVDMGGGVLANFKNLRVPPTL